jgi:hypothetical protein
MCELCKDTGKIIEIGYKIKYPEAILVEVEYEEDCPLCNKEKE